MRCEVLVDPRMFPRGDKMLKAMIAAAPIKLKVRQTYRGDCELLMVYGTGHPVRRPWQQQHLARGGRMIGWDLGYWGRRDNGTFAMRCTLDADHPQRFLRPEPGDRWARAGIELREDCNPAGHILVVGMSPKAHRAHGMKPLSWETQAVRAARAVADGRLVLYKPKRPGEPVPPGVAVVQTKNITEALRGASLVVCRHSNAAVDACIAGVPVVCEDGAASALYTGKITSPTVPTREQRLAFLQSLAWWQWTPEEAAHAWNYLLNRINCG